jgi:urease accessory protein
MPEPAGARALYRLMAWLSPAFPVGAFSYSGGLEGAVHDGLIASTADLRDWMRTLLEVGPPWNDAVLLSAGWRASVADEDVAGIAELGEALAGSAQRHMETMLQGGAFLAAARQWDAASVPTAPDSAPYPVAVGIVAARLGVALDATLTAYLLAFVQTQTQAAIRLGLMGQSAAVALTAQLEEDVHRAAARAQTASLDDLGAATVMAEITAMRHETQYSRLFRS